MPSSRCCAPPHSYSSLQTQYSTNWSEALSSSRLLSSVSCCTTSELWTTKQAQLDGLDGGTGSGSDSYLSSFWMKTCMLEQARSQSAEWCREGDWSGLATKSYPKFASSTSPDASPQCSRREETRTTPTFTVDKHCKKRCRHLQSVFDRGSQHHCRQRQMTWTSCWHMFHVGMNMTVCMYAW